MRQAYAHEAVVIVQGDDGAPGGAVAAALAGLAAHHLEAVRAGDELRLRIVFAAPPDRVEEIRDRIDAALSAGTPTWLPVRSGCARIVATDRERARRLLRD